nr:immunoglobulin heavy chain junction region [Mus musculus]MBK4184303.1 immunoglobulin heavy chain junction region [Mus musculus]MBK4184304.1 immunoglobulin heavy chain junction region [Mus musculus]MBK4184305.1 immunoglobulin heavy chain junction region [Mus musculus]MBK4184306.1 immunoglobulin heavy chain junction region [Mus musculus]
CAREWSPGAYW